MGQHREDDLLAAGPFLGLAKQQLLEAFSGELLGGMAGFDDHDFFGLGQARGAQGQQQHKGGSGKPAPVDWI